MLCGFFTDSREETVLGSIPLPSYVIAPVEPDDHINRKYAFKVTVRWHWVTSNKGFIMSMWIQANTHVYNSVPLGYRVGPPFCLHYILHCCWLLLLLLIQHVSLIISRDGYCGFVMSYKTRWDIWYLKSAQLRSLMRAVQRAGALFVLWPLTEMECTRFVVPRLKRTNQLSGLAPFSI